MTDNEIKREQPSFEVRAESLKKRTKEFFSTYENPNGSEDRLEICLIREGYRAVLMAEEEINRQKAEIERLQGLLSEWKKEAYKLADSKDEHFKICDEYAEKAKQRYSEMFDEAKGKIKAEAVKEFAERLKKCSQWLPLVAMPDPFVIVSDIDDLVKEMVGENNAPCN